MVSLIFCISLASLGISAAAIFILNLVSFYCSCDFAEKAGIALFAVMIASVIALCVSKSLIIFRILR